MGWDTKIWELPKKNRSKLGFCPNRPYRLFKHIIFSWIFFEAPLSSSPWHPFNPIPLWQPPTPYPSHFFGAPPSLDGLVWEWMQLWMATSVIFEIWLLQICKRQKMSVKDWQATSIYRTVLPYYSKSRILQRKLIRVSIIEQNSKKETTLTNFLEEISFLHRGPVAQNYSRIHLITVNS